MSVALAAEAQDCDFLGPERTQVGVRMVIDLHCDVLLAVFASVAMVVVLKLYGTGHSDLAAPHHLSYSERPHQGNERLYLLSVARELDGCRTRSDIHHMSAEGGDDRVEFRARPLIDRHLDHYHLAVDRTDVFEVGNSDDRDQLVQLLVNLLEDLVVACRDQHDPGDRRVERILVDRQGLDIEATAREKARYASQHPEFVFDQYRYCMTWHSGCLEAGILPSAAWVNALRRVDGATGAP